MPPVREPQRRRNAALVLDNLSDAVQDELKTCLNSYMPKHAP